MDAGPVSPLTDQDYETINRDLNSIALLERQIALAERAGLDCSPENSLCAALKDKLSKIKSAYFPERP